MFTNGDIKDTMASQHKLPDVLCGSVMCVCVFTARVGLVKCRDLHWAMMARRDQKDTNLSSLRMLIVADGANPCK